VNCHCRVARLMKLNSTGAPPPFAEPQVPRLKRNA
jgi:hypothetical protein